MHYSYADVCTSLFQNTKINNIKDLTAEQYLTLKELAQLEVHILKMQNPITRSIQINFLHNQLESLFKTIDDKLYYEMRSEVLKQSRNNFNVKKAISSYQQELLELQKNEQLLKEVIDRYSSYSLKNLTEALFTASKLTNLFAKTPLENEYIEDVKLILTTPYLLERIDLTETDSHRNTLIHLAARHNIPDIISKVAAAGVSIESENTTLIRPIHVAASNNNIEALLLLIKLSANIEAQKGRSETPLHGAIQQGHQEAVRILLENGANAFAVDKDSNTTVHFAAEIGNTTIIELLHKKGVPLNSINSLGKTPLQLAKENRMKAAEEILLELTQ